MKLGITMLIHSKDDIQFVTEFPCFLGHPVLIFGFTTTLIFRIGMHTQCYASSRFVIKSIMHPCSTSVQPCFQDEDAGAETCFWPTNSSVYACGRNSRVVLSVFSNIIVKLLFVSCFADYRTKIRGLMW